MESIEINHDVAFIPNAKDDMHCYQACLAMIIKYFYPDRTPNFTQLDIATGHNPGSGTWPLLGFQYLRSLGIDVLTITPFSYEDFVNDGVDYIRRLYGDEIAEWQQQNNDLIADAKMISELLPQLEIEKRDPNYGDILKFIQHYPVMVSIDSSITRGEDSYTGHFVIIRGCDNNGLYINDPGLPPRENVYIERELFEKAWSSFSGEDSKFLYPIVGYKN